MRNWFKRKKKPDLNDMINKAQERLEKSRLGGEYLMGNFESSNDSIALKLDSINFFPQIDFIFSDSKKLDNEIFSICSFELSQIDNNLEGMAHFVYAFREYGEYPSEKWYNDFCTDYRLAFKVHNDSIEILADSNLFGCSEEYEKFKNEFINNYLKSQESFIENKTDFLGNDIDTRNIIRQVGSNPMWAQNNDTPPIEGIRFIAQLDPYKLKVGEPYLFLFYDEPNKIFYQVEQFT